MRFAGHAFVDWDDTIAQNQRYFDEAAEANANLIARLTGQEFAVVRHRGEELDIEVARRVGLKADTFETAWTACYREFCGTAGIAADPDTEAAIVRACRMAYEVHQELIPGAGDALHWLHSNGFEVTIWTAGEPHVQHRKIARSGLEHLSHRAEVVLAKTPERLREALGERDLRRAFVVGNSVHSDIRPALALGLPAFHIPAETWAFDHGKLDLSDSNYRRVERITDLPAALEEWLRLSRAAG